VRDFRELFRDPSCVNLYSDTQTRPSDEMRQVMATAEVGDEQYRGDPCVIELEDRVAELLGHEAAVFLPSGTMCNQIAIRLHIRTGGDELIAHRNSHILNNEAGGAAIFSGASMAPIDSADGLFDPDDVAPLLRPQGSRFAPRTRLVCVEQTMNAAGGRVWPAERLDAVYDFASEHGLRVHLDGARLWNAMAASGLPAAAYASRADTAFVDFSKGLGAPIGGCLVGSREMIAEAWRFKQMFGGALRQSGIVAAAALWALDHNLQRLADDHDNAKRLALGLADLPDVVLDQSSVQSNMVMFEVPDAVSLRDRLAGQGVLVQAQSATRIRCVTHLDVSTEGIDRALGAFRGCLA
jgi:threonine aldolase